MFPHFPQGVLRHFLRIRIGALQVGNPNIQRLNLQPIHGLRWVLFLRGNSCHLFLNERMLFGILQAQFCQMRLGCAQVRRGVRLFFRQALKFLHTGQCFLDQLMSFAIIHAQFRQMRPGFAQVRGFGRLRGLTGLFTTYTVFPSCRFQGV